MIKEEFYRKMIALYASTANAERKQELVNAMNTVLDEKIDFDALYETVLKEHQSNTMPSIAWLDSKKRLKQVYSDSDTVYWDLTVKTNIGDYSFAIPMKYTVEQAKAAYRKKGWYYVSDNRQETRMRYGLD